MLGDAERYLKDLLLGAWGETRTLTLLPAVDFESTASTDSATQASNSLIMQDLPETVKQILLGNLKICFKKFPNV